MTPSSYIGLHVSLVLADRPHPLVGTITHIDVVRNLLELTLQTGVHTKVDKSRIKSISAVPAQLTTSISSATSQASKAAAVTTTTSGNTNDGLADFRGPEAARLPRPSQMNGPFGTTSRGKKLKKQAGGKSNVAQPDSTSAAMSTRSQGSRDQEGREARAASSSLSEDFDFEASAKSFDKVAIWEQIRAQDRSDPTALLVSHNRKGGDDGESSRGRSGTPLGRGRGVPGEESKMRKLRIDENVLSPSPEREKGERKGGVAAADKMNTPAAAASVASVTSVSGPSASSESQAVNSGSTASSREIHKLQSENTILKRQLFVLENLSGLSLKIPALTAAHSEDQLDFECVLSRPALLAQGRDEEAITFYLQTSLQPNDPKLRFKPVSGANGGSTTGTAHSAASASPQGRLPEKYNREMGLKLDNGSARVFIERLRGSI